MHRWNRFILAALVLSLCPFVIAQDDHSSLQKKLDGMYQLTKMSADSMDIVKAGSILVLHKDGLLLCSIDAHTPITNSYKGGRLAAGRAKWGFEMGIKQSDLPTAQVPTKVFDEGEKIWVSSIAVEKNGIVLKVYSDPYDNVRYWGQIEIPFDKKAVPSDDELLKQLGEVVTVDVPKEVADIPAPGSAADTTAAAALNNPKDQIKAKLADLLVLTQGKLETGEITKAGSIIELRKDGLPMWPTDTGVLPIYTFKDGKFSMPLAAWSQAHTALHAKDPDLNPYNVQNRKFVAGEKFWIVDYKVRDNGVFLTFVSDPYNDVRYYSSIWFPFDKKQPIPAADDFMKAMAQIIGVEAPPVQQAAQPAAPVAPPAPSQPAIAPIEAPPAPPKTVVIGQSRAELEAILGQPPKVAVVGTKQIYYYPDMKITLVNGKVANIQ